ncbi:hypothetical protein [Tumebacillus permanentifrigoris]|nr:hypothetical protein [Tumebacillus permanentifrigoris]
MGEPTSPVRNSEVSQLMDYAFANYKSEVLFQKGQEVQQVEIDKGDTPKLALLAGDTVGILMKKGTKKEEYQSEIIVNEIQAPVKKGQVVGSIVIKQGGNEIAKTDLVAAADCGEAGMWTLFKRTVKSWFTFGG